MNTDWISETRNIAGNAKLKFDPKSSELVAPSIFEVDSDGFRVEASPRYRF